MASFMPITVGCDLFRVDRINELWLGLYERGRVCGAGYLPSPPVEIPIGHDIQQASFWDYIQERIEAFCPGFVDHRVDLSTVEAVPMFTCETARTLAGLPNGWRRYTAANQWDYGRMEPGDAIGPWIFQDIQAMLSTLRKTQLSIHNHSYFQRYSGEGYGSTIAAANADLVSNWHENDFTRPWYESGSLLKVYSEIMFQALAFRSVHTISMNVTTDVPCLIDCWGLAKGWVYDGQLFFEDQDGIGLTLDRHKLLETLSAVTPPVAIRNSTALWATATAALTRSSLGLGGCYILTRPIAEWQFSHTL